MRRPLRSLLLILAIVVAPRLATACDVDDEYLAKQLRTFYTAHARPVPQPEHRLPDGTTWRVIVDSVTGVAEARITGMADAAAMETANRLLETLHACRLMEYWTYTVGYRLSSTLLDLERQTVVGSDRHCRRADEASRPVVISGLIEVCSVGDQEAFEALWRKHATLARADATSRGQEPCVPPQDDGPTNRVFETYITAGGLAVYSGYLWPRPFR